MYVDDSNHSDVTCDGIVGVNDLLMVIGAWGEARRWRADQASPTTSDSTFLPSSSF